MSTSKYDRLSMGGDLTYRMNVGTHTFTKNNPDFPNLDRIVSNDDTLTISVLEDEKGNNLLAMMNQLPADTVGKGMVLNPAGRKITKVVITAGSAYGIVQK